jgi:hypothetical protein
MPPPVEWPIDDGINFSACKRCGVCGLPPRSHDPPAAQPPFSRMVYIEPLHTCSAGFAVNFLHEPSRIQAKNMRNDEDLKRIHVGEVDVTMMSQFRETSVCMSRPIMGVAWAWASELQLNGSCRTPESSAMCGLHGYILIDV